MLKRNWLTRSLTFDVDWKLWATPFFEVNFCRPLFWVCITVGPFTLMWTPGIGGPAPDHEDDCNLCSPCESCDGSGRVYDIDGGPNGDFEITCPDCGGSGNESEPCEGCDGAGGSCACCKGAKVVKSSCSKGCP